jgi:predicted DCC family thiol-disulfide oxidoreductase YuxK
MRSLTIIYDPACGLCTRLAQWLTVQRQYVPLRLVPSSSPMIASVYPELAESRFREELIVVADDGAVWFGDRAWILCLYALVDYRAWAKRLSRPALFPFARQAFMFLSHNRRRLSSWMRLAPQQASDGEIADRLRNVYAPGCQGAAPRG